LHENDVVPEQAVPLLAFGAEPTRHLQPIIATLSDEIPATTKLLVRVVEGSLVLIVVTGGVESDATVNVITELTELALPKPSIQRT
jgi:hypothetical protein